MPNTLNTALRYLFIIAVILVISVYFVGASTVGATLFSGATTLFNNATGRNSQGQFANYPSNPTTPGH